jgi:hypothetical protein
MKPSNSYAGVVYWIATVAATVTLTTHVSQWSRYGNEEQKATIASENVALQTAMASVEQKLTAPYRDGVYLAKLAQQRGEQRTPSVGRWATEEQRHAFSAGYGQGNTRIAEVSGN